MIHLKQIGDIQRRIVSAFHPRRIILFGSYARGDATVDSDVDILVILPFQGKNFDMSLEILNRVDARIPLDLLARRPDDVKRRYAEGDTLIRDALDNGRVLYEQDC